MLAKRSAGQAAAAIAEKVANDFNGLASAWPEILPTLSRLVAAPADTTTRVIALGVLKDLAGTIGDGLLANSGLQTLSMLSSTISDPCSQVSSAGVQLVLAFIEKLSLKDVLPLGELMPALIGRMQSFANDLAEEPLKDTLTALTSAIEEEPEYFLQHGLQELWATLVKLCETMPDTFADSSIRHQAMESATCLAVGLSDDHFSKAEGLPMLEQLVELNLAWMWYADEDVQTWTEEGRHTDEDDCDIDDVRLGEENLDQLGENFEETVLMPIVLKKATRTGLKGSDASWLQIRSAVMMVSQVVEYIEDDMAYVDQCLDFIAQYFTHPHPRVSYAAFVAAGQVCYDHGEHVAAASQTVLLPALIAGMRDDNIRVATAAVNSFSALAEELDTDDLEEYAEPALTILFERLQSKQSRILQEHCLSAIAAIAEVQEDEFATYYSKVMPVLKSVISEATSADEKSLRGKAFVCISLIIAAVGKEESAEDAQEVMWAMVKTVQSGFADDDPQKESVQEAIGKLATTLGKDFKPFVSSLLPSVVSLLDQRPAEVPAYDASDDEDETKDMSLTVVGDKVFGLRTTLIVEMEAALEQVNTFIKALEEDYCEFIPVTCKHLLPLLDFPLSTSLQNSAFETLEALVKGAREGLNNGKIDMNTMRELLSEFLKKVVVSMTNTPAGDALDDAACSSLQSQAIGLAGIIEAAGSSVLTGDVLKDIAAVLVKLLDQIRCGKEVQALPGSHMRKGLFIQGEANEAEDEDIDEPVTAQTVCFSLADALRCLMVSNIDAFAQTVLPTLMELVQNLMQTGMSDSCRGLAFYIADDVVDVMGEKSVPYWNWLMNLALSGSVDKCAVVRQFATSTIGNGSRLKVFATMATASAGQLCSVISKQGERHRRRKAVKAEMKQNALAVDACIKALGLICEHQEEALGIHGATSWSMWLSNLPIKYDADAARKTHAQLVGLLTRRHPALVALEHQVKLVEILADIFKTNLSTSSLDKDIVAAVAQIGEEPIKQLASGLSEAKQRKIEQLLKAAAKAVAA
eukprot:TRINITY_DN20285_c0_g1_i1.p1 TRINITY_DN20285_c0_g1~~TRINITY_DN20285_c0_g1_i1.p1  ORF type:complete len:1156 (-),score=256.68 TRINITY_DN20285_c0_g1_i1:242-3340(-)